MTRRIVENYREKDRFNPYDYDHVNDALCRKFFSRLHIIKMENKDFIMLILRLCHFLYSSSKLLKVISIYTGIY